MSKIDINQFKDRWLFFPIEQTLKINFELFGKVDEIAKLADEFYLSIVKLYPWWRTIRPCIKQYIYPWLSPEEKAFLSNDLGNTFYEIWLANIGGRKYGFRAGVKEKVAFFKYMFQLLTIKHQPEKYEINERYQSLLFSHRMLRPNIDAHIYITMSFEIRPIKKFIRQYCEMAVITGSYEFLFRRFKPYHTMLHLNIGPGQRTHLDFRKGLDFPPIIYKLPMKYNCAIELDKVQTRTSNRFITCRACHDQKAENERHAEIEQLTKTLPLKNFSYVGNVDFKDGKVYYGEINEEIVIQSDECIEILVGFISAVLSGVLFAKIYEGPIFYKIILGILIGIVSGIIAGYIYKKTDQKIDTKKKEKIEKNLEEIPMYAFRRNLYLKIFSEINLLKANPRPGPDSGLIIRFQLLHPLAPLIEGINRKRDLSLDELELVWKTLDLLEGDRKKPEKEQKGKFKIVEDAFNKKDNAGLKDETIEFLDVIHRLRAEDPTEEKAWQFLSDRFIEGKAKNLLNAVCLRSIGDGFEVVFNLWPLLTGMEISIDKSTGEVKIKTDEEIEEYRDTGNDLKKFRRRKKKTLEAESDKLPDKKQLLPVLEILKHEMEDLLKNVFNKYLDISPATSRIRSEPILAGMIAEYCLNVKSDTKEFLKKLTVHLTKHYLVHDNFMGQYLVKNPERKDMAPTVLSDIHNVRVNREKMIEHDVNGIIELIEATRDRLYSTTGCLRLLCFIDPKSVDVQLGDFFYEGMEFEAEEKFIRRLKEIQDELALTESEERKGVEQLNIMIKHGKLKIDMNTKKLQVVENYKILESQSLRRITEIDIDKAFSEAKHLAVEKLKQGEIKDYGTLSLIKAHYEGGAEAVEKILRESPNLVMAIDPELHHHQATHEIKEHVLDILHHNPEQMDKVTTAMLLSKEFKDIVAKDIYEEFNDTFVEMLNKTRLGIPYVPLRQNTGGIGSDLRGEGQKGMGARSEENDLDTVRNESIREITDQNLPEPETEPDE